MSNEGSHADIGLQTIGAPGPTLPSPKRRTAWIRCFDVHPVTARKSLYGTAARGFRSLSYGFCPEFVVLVLGLGVLGDCLQLSTPYGWRRVAMRRPRNS